MASRMIVVASCVLAGAAVLGACGSDTKTVATATTTTAASSATTGNTTSTTGAASGGGGTVTIKGFAFTGGPVKAGSKVDVTNQDAAPHTATGDSKEFDTGIIDGNKSGSFTAPSQPGSYTYHCNVHPTMKATLTVT